MPTDCFPVVTPKGSHRPEPEVGYGAEKQPLGQFPIEGGLQGLADFLACMPAYKTGHNRDTKMDSIEQQQILYQASACLSRGLVVEITLEAPLSHG